MKKALKIFSIVILVIIGVMIIVPFAMKGKIKQLVRYEANELLTATFDFEDLSLNLFRSFPKVSVEIENVSIVGSEPFQGDTLFASKKIYAAIDIFSLFSKKGFTITKVLIDEAYIQGLVNEDGVTNWDIVKSDDDPQKSKAVNDEDALNLRLKSFTIKNSHILYNDIPEKIFADLYPVNINLKGDMYEDETKLATEIKVGSCNLKMNEIPYLVGVAIRSKIDLEANLKTNRYTFKDNELDLNAFHTSFNGWIEMPDTTQVNMDVQLNTADVNFKELISLIPNVYKSDFKNLDASGNVQMSVWAKGKLSDTTIPSFETKLVVNNGSFKYPELPETIKDINMDFEAYCITDNQKDVNVLLNKLHFILAGNSFDMHAKATDLTDALHFEATAFGQIDLQKLAQAFPFDDQSNMKGNIRMDCSVSGIMSDIEKELYEKINAKGTISVKDVIYNQNNKPSLNIQEAVLKFSPKYITLDPFTAIYGKNDLSLKGNLENVFPYIFRDKLLKGKLLVESNNINLNDFMNLTDSTENSSNSQKDTVPTELLIIPKNLDLTLEANIKKIVYDAIVLSNVNGTFVLKDGIANLKQITLNAFDGSLLTSGSYDTSNPEKPKADLKLDINKASFGKTFNSVNTIKQIAPIFDHMTGTYSMNLNMSSDLLPDMSPNLKTVNAKGVLKSQDVKIEGVESLNALADLIKYPALKQIQPKDLNIDFTINDGQILITPFTIKLGDMAMTLGGTSGLDQTMNYTGSLKLNDKSLNVMGVDVKEIPFIMKGTYKSPKISLDAKKLTSQALSGSLNKISDKLGIDLDTTNGDLKDAAKQEAIAAAKKAGDKLVDEAKKQGQALVDKAGNNILKKLAAQKAADKLLEEAQKSADTLLKKAQE